MILGLFIVIVSSFLFFFTFQAQVRCYSIPRTLNNRQYFVFCFQFSKSKERSLILIGTFDRESYWRNFTYMYIHNTI